MILAFDTYYFDDKAKAVCIQFDEWLSVSASFVHTEIVECIEDYIPGEFYKRELPCILSLLQKMDLTSVEVIVIDGYVFLDDEEKPGLGVHPYKALGQIYL